MIQISSINMDHSSMIQDHSLYEINSHKNSQSFRAQEINDFQLEINRLKTENQKLIASIDEYREKITFLQSEINDFKVSNAFLLKESQYCNKLIKFLKGSDILKELDRLGSESDTSVNNFPSAFQETVKPNNFKVYFEEEDGNRQRSAPISSGERLNHDKDTSCVKKWEANEENLTINLDQLSIKLSKLKTNPSLRKQGIITLEQKLINESIISPIGIRFFELEASKSNFNHYFDFIYIKDLIALTENLNFQKNPPIIQTENSFSFVRYLRRSILTSDCLDPALLTLKISHL